MDLLSVCIATVESVDFKNVSAGFGYKCSDILSTFKTVKVRLLRCFRRKITAEFLPHNSLHPAVGATVTHTKTFRPQINISTVYSPAALLLLDDDVQRVFIHFLIVWFKKIMGTAVILNRRQCRRWKWADNWFPVAAWVWRSCRWRSCLAALMRLLMKRFNQVPLKQQWGELKCKRRVWS